MTEPIIDPNWIKKAPRWKVLLAKLFGKRTAGGIDGEVYMVCYYFLGKKYYDFEPSFMKILNKKAKEGIKIRKWWMSFINND